MFYEHVILDPFQVSIRDLNRQIENGWLPISERVDTTFGDNVHFFRMYKFVKCQQMFAKLGFNFGKFNFE